MPSEFRVHRPRIEFDLAKIENRMKRVSAHARRNHVRMLFPVKSFPAPQVLKLAARYLDGFDVSNRAEYQLIRKFASRGKDIWVSGPVHEVPSHPFKNRLKVAANSTDAFFHSRSKKFGALRINASTILKRVDEGRFGASFREALNAPVDSFSVHMGFQSTTVEDLMRMFLKFHELSKKRKIQSVNFGGGWERLSEDDAKWLMTEIGRRKPNFQVFFEPGRWWSQDAGVIETEILDVRTHPDGWDVTLSGSRMAHLKWSQLRLNKIPRQITNARTKKSIRFFGPTCAEDDFLLKIAGKITDPSKCVGQTISLEGVCGYSFAWNTGFNGFAPARIAFKQKR